MITEEECNIISGKMYDGVASQKEMQEYLTYVSALENMIEEASEDDVFGTEGWKHHLGWDV